RAGLLADQVVRAAPRARWPLRLAAVLALTLVGLAAALRAGPAPSAAGALDPAAGVVAAQPLPAARDAQGERLPDGAGARLGTTRWRHGGITGFVAFLPDGQHVVSAGHDSVFHVWEFPSGKGIRRFVPRVDA